MDWSSGILATGSWDATVKVWQCNELNGYLVNIEHDFLAQLDHNSQVLELTPLLLQTCDKLLYSCQFPVLSRENVDSSIIIENIKNQ